MKNSKIVRKISQGMYVLTTSGGGCIVDAVMQISAGDNPLIAVSVMKSNYTNELLKTNERFGISVLGMTSDSDIINTFGFNSMRDIDKFENVDVTNVCGIDIINDSLGYMICDIVDSIDNETHTLFIGRLIEGDVFDDGEVMTYSYYQEHKDELLKTITKEGKTLWVCSICGYIYYGEELPSDYRCPKCGVPSGLFEKNEK